MVSLVGESARERSLAFWGPKNERAGTKFGESHALSVSAIFVVVVHFNF